MTPTRVWACILGLHAWTRTLGPSTYAHACRYCGHPRTR